mmetsp:Transcript_15603/g.26362  ORF Transcript_15603/g.26362 Transcript_15603/m.26362 type:complete len:143 (+) Transcript_15603:134-562(+)|eukprot:CAMPEP_0168622020 /NCGR_PEP_ID=MMETSP0449_2-20121227/8025_1 /TAXON_ID=1082188 /ORGANISM="Strombidium rassoulzadegani, Strain ras09" /LENGTH=142 /DNA_ID=CAMNT_0008663219 /DNA_START=94 /DNA_END=522 /DNA_ORIENTATION=-
MARQFDLIPRIIVVYLVYLILLFGHAILVLNLNEVRSNTIALSDNEKMTNWVLYTLFVYYFLKTAQAFGADFKRLMSDSKIDERKSCKAQLKFFKTAFASCLVSSLWVFIRFHLKVSEEDRVNDKRVRLMYMPILVCGLTLI